MELKPRDGEIMKGNPYVRSFKASTADGAVIGQSLFALAYEQRTANLLDAYRILREHGEDTHLAKYINPREAAAQLAHRLGFGTDDE